MKNFLWIFFCLGLAPICNLCKTIVTVVQIRQNEAAAARSILTIRRLQSSYAAKNRGKFAPSFDELIKTEALDEKFSGPNPFVDGYIFTLKVEEPSATRSSFYSVNADPQVSEGNTATEIRRFYSDSVIQVIKMSCENRPANANDPSI